MGVFAHRINAHDILSGVIAKSVLNVAHFFHVSLFPHVAKTVGNVWTSSTEDKGNKNNGTDQPKTMVLSYYTFPYSFSFSFSTYHKKTGE